ncbi:hypothetical protein N9061_00655 [bacterium]|nr:hypothetical protein [bacterium]
MSNDELARALERCEQNKISNEARLAKAKARAELVRCFHDQWRLIFADKPTDSTGFNNWLDQYNDRVELFLDVVRKSRLGEFLSAIQSSNDHESICVGLLNQSAADRKRTLKRLLEGPLTTWQQPFQNTLLVDRLLGWGVWIDASTFDERYLLYKSNCLETQNLGYGEVYMQSGFRHCRKQWELLKSDPNCPKDKELVRLDYDKDKSSSVDTDEANGSNAQKTVLIEDCKNAILVYWFLNQLPQSVKIWHDDGCSLSRIPATADPEFEQLVQDLKYHSSPIGKSTEPKQKPAGRSLNDNTVLFIAALTLHHRYEDGSVLNFEPISLKDTGLSKAAASRQFKTHFDSHYLYAQACRNGDINRLLKKLNGDFGPRLLRQDAQI